MAPQTFPPGGSIDNPDDPDAPPDMAQPPDDPAPSGTPPVNDWTFTWGPATRS